MQPAPKTNRLLLLIALLLTGALLAGCNLPKNIAPTEADVGMIYTAAARTLVAQYTLVARPTPTFPPLPTIILNTPAATPEPEGSSTTAPSGSATPATATPPAAGTPICDRAKFVEDITIPDNARIEPGATFVKTWRLQNVGECTWTGAYRLVFAKGDQMGAPAAATLPPGDVAPQATVDVSVSLKAPLLIGEYQADFLLRNASGVNFGLGPESSGTFWVRVRVGTLEGLALDLVAAASEADWSIQKGSTKSGLVFGGDLANPNGAARILDDVLLETGGNSSVILVTYPPQVTDGVVEGIYDPYLVQPGDRFKASLGFLANADGKCGEGKVVFRLRYAEGSAVRTLGDWRKSCTGSLLPVDVDLDALKGKTIRFILHVFADGAAVDDFAFWNSPRIER